MPTPKPMLLNEPERSRDVSYLLDDEEDEGGSPPNRVLRVFLLLVGLALIGGFGYMYLLSGDQFSVLKARLLKPATPKADAAPDSEPTPAAPAPVTTAPQPASPTTQAPVPPPDTTKAATPPADSAPTNEPEVKQEPEKPAPQPPAPPQAAAAKPSPKPALTKTASTQPPVKPSPVLKPTTDLVAQAEKMIYGDGVPQDCEHGLGVMRPLAQAADSRAMVALGVLYTTGTCVPRDLPTAYSWYAKALHKSPDNVTLQQDMKQVWGQMTPPERQLAIRLTQ